MKPQKKTFHLSKHLALPQVSFMGLLLLLWALSACSTDPSNSFARASAATPVPTCSVHTPVSAPPLTGEGLQKMVSLPGQPFASVATRDGHWIFVSLIVPGPANSNGIAVLQSNGGNTKIMHFIALPRPLSPTGLTLTHDEQMLVVADGTGVSVLDTAKMKAGTANALLGSISDGTSTGPIQSAGTIEVALSRDEHYLFATDEIANSMSVINFQRLRSGDFSSHAYVGRVPLDLAPVGMALSPDNRYMYVTSEISVSPSQSGSGAASQTAGTLTVVDVPRAERDPSHAAVGRVFAGCSPVRVILSSQGDLAWVTARGSNTLLAFKTLLLLRDPAHALIATIPVGPAPVGLILIHHGAEIVVANSNRFAGGQSSQTVVLVDVRRALSGHSALLGSITVGNFPREMALDGQTLLLTNFASKTLSLIDLSKLP